MASLKEVKKGKNFVLYTDGTNELVLLKNVRFSFPHYGTKHEQEDKESGKVRQTWGGTGMMPKDTHEAACEELERIIKKFLTENEAKVPRDKRFLKDGDDEEADNPEEYKGHWIVTFAESAMPGKGGRSPVRPPVRNEFGKLMIDPEKGHDPDYVRQAVEAIDEKFYGGCWGNVLIRPWYFSGKAANGETYPKRILCGYAGVQFVKDDKAFGQGRIDSSNAAWDTSDDDGNDDGLGTTSKSTKKTSSSDDEDF